MRRFLIDNQLPATLAAWFEARGCSAVHVLTTGLAQAPDDEIWTKASTEGLVIITKDEDFSRLVVLRPEPVQVVWLRIGNCRTKALLKRMEQAWPAISDELGKGSRLIEVV